MLSGTFTPTMDVKGRFNFPAKLRDELGGRFYAAYGLDHCVAVYSEEGWQAVRDRLMEQPSGKTKDLARLLFSRSVQLEPDKQGRVQIPEHLRKYANLQKELCVVGVADRVEIWDKAAWADKYPEPTDEEIDEMFEALGL